MLLLAVAAAILCCVSPISAFSDEANATTQAGFVSILPPLLAIATALLFRQVIPALFVGLWFGASAVHGLSFRSAWIGFLDTVQVYVVNAIADADHTAIIVFSLMIGGMVGIISRSGGMLGVVSHVVRFATNHRRAQLGAAGLGLGIFFDDYANTLVVGNTMRPVADRLRVSREKLAYIVDSTAAPVACIAFVTTWIGYEVGLIAAAVTLLDGSHEPYSIFLNSIAYSYYPILAILFVLMVASSGRDFGPMHAAEQRAREGNLREEESGPFPGTGIDQIASKPGVESRAFNAVVPIAVLLLSVMVGLRLTGEGDNFRDIIGSANSYKALVWGSLLGVAVAGITAVASRALTLTEAIEAWLGGMKAMLMAMIILVLAWSLANVTETLGTANYLVSLLGDTVPGSLLPTLVFLLAAFTAFATGSSWGTMGILMPLVVPLTWALISSDGQAEARSLPIFYSAIASVLAGAVWGDHCSPISDTTVLSSMASGCDHIAHVQTQMPYALLVGAVAVLGGTLPVGFGMPWWLGLLIGSAALWIALRTVGRSQ